MSRGSGNRDFLASPVANVRRDAWLRGSRIAHPPLTRSAYGPIASSLCGTLLIAVAGRHGVIAGAAPLAPDDKLDAGTAARARAQRVGWHSRVIIQTPDGRRSTR